MRKVVDLATRTYHWLFAASFLGAYLSADSEKFRLLHVTLGYTMIGLLGFRLVWGMFGPRHMRLSAMFRKLKGLKPLREAFRSGQLLQASHLKQSANLLMSWVIVALLISVIPLTLSGYAVYHELAGKWLEEIHEFFGELMLWMVVIHLIMIAVVSLLRRTNLAQSMITGSVSGTGPDLIKSEYSVVSVVILMSVLAWIIGYMFFIS
ncbi:cytochrome b/b6 domain-containing protein [Zwartia panacis]|jgi:cytochrome b|uniref:cytochrome b/b6 domain-containing protein n=1 Tax=Zwartia panacis TaxID=2683345 RepID=UPI0025B5E779|nr:cytochrome b/b6 domain-containing protein [Zwartia panacis]MDN4017175.1 cytochrome b/b6 domain-containing protein [Zwartia panacis]